MRRRKVVAVAPAYATGDLVKILTIEQRQVEDTVADLTDEQMTWRPNPAAKSALDILWHLAYDVSPEHPASKEEALAALRTQYEDVVRDIRDAAKMQEEITWWNGQRMPYVGTVWAQIRHRSYHLGELVYLRQVMGVDRPRYYHEARPRVAAPAET